MSIFYVVKFDNVQNAPFFGFFAHFSHFLAHFDENHLAALLISDDIVIVVCLGDFVCHRTSNSQVRPAAPIGQKDNFNRILPQTEVCFQRR